MPDLRLLDRERLVDEESAGQKGTLQGSEEGALQVTHDDHESGAQIRRGAWNLEVQGQRPQGHTGPQGEVARLLERVREPVDRRHAEPLHGQVDRVAPRTAREIERGASGRRRVPRERLDERRGRLPQVHARRRAGLGRELVAPGVAGEVTHVGMARGAQRPHDEIEPVARPAHQKEGAPASRQEIRSMQQVVDLETHRARGSVHRVLLGRPQVDTGCGTQRRVRHCRSRWGRRLLNRGCTSRRCGA